MSDLFNDRNERRDRLQVMADIIKVAETESKITRILRLANVQYNTLLEYIEQLCESGLLEEVPSNSIQRKRRKTKNVYKATKSGLEWRDEITKLYYLIDLES